MESTGLGVLDPRMRGDDNGKRSGALHAAICQQRTRHTRQRLPLFLLFSLTLKITGRVKLKPSSASSGGG